MQEIVIKIPEETYRDVIKNGFIYDEDGEAICYAIINGIVLPKEHGRLIDADALKKDDEVTEWLSLNAIRTGKMLKKFSELFIKKIDATKTIIEADRSEE